MLGSVPAEEDAVIDCAAPESPLALADLAGDATVLGFAAALALEGPATGCFDDAERAVTAQTATIASMSSSSIPRPAPA